MIGQTDAGKACGYAKDAGTVRTTRTAMAQARAMYYRCVSHRCGQDNASGRSQVAMNRLGLAGRERSGRAA
jgi:hypothetical protein